MIFLKLYYSRRKFFLSILSVSLVLIFAYLSGRERGKIIAVYQELHITLEVLFKICHTCNHYFSHVATENDWPTEEIPHCRTHKLLTVALSPDSSLIVCTKAEIILFPASLAFIYVVPSALVACSATFPSCAISAHCSRPKSDANALSSKM